MLQTFGVQDSTEILWLSRKRFIAHQIYVEGIEGATLEQKERAATDRWMKDMQNPDIAKRGTGEDLQLGVVGVSRTVGFRGRESRKEITCSDTIVSGKQMDSYLKDMACHGMSGQALTGKAMGAFGSPFAPGAASSSSVTALAALPAQAPSAPPSSVVCKPEALEPTPGFTGTLATLDRKRALGRTASDPLKRPNGGAIEVEQLAWVPSQWKKQNMTPEALRTLGSPWLVPCEPVGARKDVTQWPLPGFGHFIIPQRGSMLVCLIPVESLLERGCEISNGLSSSRNCHGRTSNSLLPRNCHLPSLSFVMRFGFPTDGGAFSWHATPPSFVTRFTYLTCLQRWLCRPRGRKNLSRLPRLSCTIGRG
jgi:hypothetical protein